MTQISFVVLLVLIGLSQSPSLREVIKLKRSDALLATRLLRLTSTFIVILVDVWGVFPFAINTAIQSGASADQALWAGVVVFIAVLAAWLGKLVFMLKVSR